MFEQRQTLDDRLQRLIWCHVGRQHRLRQRNVQHLKVLKLAYRRHFALKRPHVEQYQRLQLWEVDEAVQAEVGEETRSEVEIGEFA